jgi:uncharacterized FAD-dependent dehydrogenase
MSELSQQTLVLTPEQAYHMAEQYRVVKRSIDARQRQLKVNLTLLLDENGHPLPKDAPIGTPCEQSSVGAPPPLYTPPVFQDVHNAPRHVHIIGAGPAGLFAALTLIEHGIKPIIYERGKEVSERKRDIAQLNRNVSLNAESNYCFGEGGAGTFSDGKLFSRSKKRGNMQRVMELFHYFGAPDTVLYETHAHIGSDKLPGIIRAMRECIIAHGGEIHFDTKIESLTQISNLQSSIFNLPSPIILAIGHSAHDTYRMLAQEGVALQTKGFAMGVRVEHPQALINRLMYHTTDVSYVGNASYSLVTQVDGRGVYSFCMCPGGHMVPATSSTDACVVNGMSASHRNSPYANSGIVVQINPEDIPAISNLQSPISDPLAGLHAQELVENLAFIHGGAPAIAPAQRLADFVRGKRSADLPACSYLPGTRSSALHEWMPPFIAERLRQGFRDFDRKYPGFLTNDALILATESRSSSAVRIPRDPDTLQSLSHPNLYPCGEGAGYAGGITSSALDGINAALHIAAL